ncbi:MAG: hypothetical protein K2K97_08990 [Muribaculaceae bacterium]|nr:hypothetical protein [Muribaculaceae bacterium]
MRLILVSVVALAGLFGFTSAAQKIGEEYRLKKVVPVEGRQGIAVDSAYYYVSDTKGLYKYDKDWNLIASNLQPFQHPEVANHFGDIDVWNGEIYCGIEKFEYGRGYNIAVSIYDAGTLEWKRDLPWRSESGQVEVSGIAVDRDKNMVWMSDWVDSRYVYCYDLKTGEYHTKMQCAPTPYWCQGITIAGDKILFSSDDGEAMYNLPDNLYVCELGDVPFTGLIDGEEVVKATPFSVQLDENGSPVMRKGKVAGGAKKGNIRHLREMSDFKRAGEIEGVAIDPVNDDLLVLNNRGTQIVLGMSQGPLTDEGYTREIHEVYIYEKIR